MERSKNPRAPLSRPSLRHARTPSSLERMSASVMTWRPLPPHEHSPLICERERSGLRVSGDVRRGWRGREVLKKISPSGGSCGYGPAGPQTAGRARRGGAESRLGRRRTPALGSGRKKRSGGNRRDPGATGGIAASCVSRSARATPASTHFKRAGRSGRENPFAYLDRDVLLCLLLSGDDRMPNLGGTVHDDVRGPAAFERGQHEPEPEPSRAEVHVELVCWWGGCGRVHA